MKSSNAYPLNPETGIHIPGHTEKNFPANVFCLFVFPFTNGLTNNASTQLCTTNISAQTVQEVKGGRKVEPKKLLFLPPLSLFFKLKL